MCFSLTFILKFKEKKKTTATVSTPNLQWRGNRRNKFIENKFGDWEKNPDIRRILIAITNYVRF